MSRKDKGHVGLARHVAKCKHEEESYDEGNRTKAIQGRVHGEDLCVIAIREAGYVYDMWVDLECKTCN